ncbi:hypothetical protein [Dictyobacter kobayashii]|nr:hypothetical protein [Dictyobacter kobayashii]
MPLELPRVPTGSLKKPITAIEQRAIMIHRIRVLVVACAVVLK